MCEIMCAMSIDWNNARMLRVCVCGVGSMNRTGSAKISWKKSANRIYTEDGMCVCVCVANLNMNRTHMRSAHIIEIQC